MDQIQLCICENCGRSNQSVIVANHTIHQHVAQLCPTCMHILSLPTNEARFLQLVRKKSKQASNSEMQKIHKKLSMLLAVAGLFVSMIATTVITQSMDMQASSNSHVSEQETDEYLSFAYLNRDNYK